jgi:hypothetical protein
MKRKSKKTEPKIGFYKDDSSLFSDFDEKAVGKRVNHGNFKNPVCNGFGDFDVTPVEMPLKGEKFANPVSTSQKKSIIKKSTVFDNVSNSTTPTPIKEVGDSNKPFPSDLNSGFNGNMVEIEIPQTDFNPQLEAAVNEFDSVEFLDNSTSSSTASQMAERDRTKELLDKLTNSTHSFPEKNVVDRANSAFDWSDVPDSKTVQLQDPNPEISQPKKSNDFSPLGNDFSGSELVDLDK